MTTAVLARPQHSATSASSSELSGTGQLLRLYLRRDRIILPLWVLLLSVPLSSAYVSSVESVYPTAADRASFLDSIMGSPAQRAMYGVIYNDSLGAVGIWKAGMFHTLIAVAVILSVIRHTRAEEETGRAELLESTSVGRYASLTATLILGFGASLATGLIGTAGLLTTDVTKAGSVAFGLALAGSGIVFAAVAAVAAQLSAGARIARMIAFAALGATFALRAVGDAGNGVLTWLAPQGWSLQVRPYAGERWWVLLLHLATAVAFTIVAYLLLHRRDVGAGLIAERPGKPMAAVTLSGVFGLGWRLHRGVLIAATIGLCLYALLIGSVVNGIGDELGDSDAIADMVNRMGGSQALEDSFITIAFTMLAVGAGALAISAALRLYNEESALRLESVLTGSVSRIRWAASHIVFALVGPAVAMTAAGLVAGLVYGLAADDIGAKLPGVLGAALVQLPAIWMLAGITVLLFGLVPRFTPVVWGVLVGFITLFLLGSISGFPEWLLDLEPFTHTPRVPGQEFQAAPVVWMLLIDVALLTVGLYAFHRRDLR
ncbi:ABC transporter permease [Nocardia sp. 2YAB30]|uniref:ABC transporter permease n=1 Tax=unclassified Nocardia TaxID=2637762 RepID=UPI003F9E56F6